MRDGSSTWSFYEAHHPSTVPKYRDNFKWLTWDLLGETWHSEMIQVGFQSFIQQNLNYPLSLLFKLTVGIFLFTFRHTIVPLHLVRVQFSIPTYLRYTPVHQKKSLERAWIEPGYSCFTTAWPWLHRPTGFELDSLKPKQYLLDGVEYGTSGQRVAGTNWS